ncbi:MAG: hypothetical protein ACFB16_13530 [Phormidesmis sp.]
MTQILAISEAMTTFRQVEEKLGLYLSDDPAFFPEWSEDLSDLPAAVRSRLDAVRKNYLYQISDGALLEETIKLVILSPLLKLAGFYSTPYKFRAEVPVEIEALGNSNEVLRRRIDGLVLLEQLWIVVIESKKKHIIRFTHIGQSFDMAITVAFVFIREVVDVAKKRRWRTCRTYAIQQPISQPLNPQQLNTSNIAPPTRPTPPVR